MARLPRALNAAILRAHRAWEGAVRSAKADPRNFAKAAAFDRSVTFGPEARIENRTGRRSSIAIGRKTYMGNVHAIAFEGGRISIGEDCYFAGSVNLWAMESIEIGDRALFSTNVSIFDNNSHPTDAEERYRHSRKGDADVSIGKGPVVLGKDVWVGCNVVILKGVRIGDGAVIAAGSVVSSDVPARTVAAGNPAKAVKPVDA